jgi:uncharacterized protein
MQAINRKAEYCDKENRIKELRQWLERTKATEPQDLAANIKKMGFKCLGCGRCCTGEDNSVVVFPFEIRRIMQFTGETWLQTVEPPAEGEWDLHGNFHTLEWRIKKEGASCKFYSVNGCRIYEVRPMICRTYPFYLDYDVLRCSECSGLGIENSPHDAEIMAACLIKRCAIEIKESISLLEKYQDFERGIQKKGQALIVHDSEGEHRIIGNTS